MPAAELLERTTELAEASEALADVARGRGRVVLVEAPAGLGKTSVLNAVGREAVERGFTCLRARASDLERDFAYGCVRQLFEPVLAAVPPAERGQLFGGTAALAQPLFAPAGLTEATTSPASSYSMLHGLYWLLTNLATQRPVVLLVDDVHWADAESLRFLAYLTPRLDGLAVLVLGARRAGEGSAAELARLAIAPETTVVRPAPLSLEATGRLCAHRLGAPVDAAFAAACRRATGGNPFFLEALLQEVARQRVPADARGVERVQRLGPASVAQAVLLRIAGVAPEAMDLVRAFAVLGDGASLAEAAGLAGVEIDAAAPVADLLVRLAILAPGPRGLEFAHPIVREAVYADMGAQQRAVAHARAARILAGARCSDERVAAQIVEAEPVGDPERVTFLRRVADAATSRGAPAAAVAWLRRALVEPAAGTERGEVLFELGTAELRLGDPAATEHLAAAVGLVREPLLLARTVRQLANSLAVSGDADAAVQAIASATTVVGADRELALHLEAEAASHALRASPRRRAAAAERLARLTDLAGATPGERLVLASIANQRARDSETAAEAAGHLERALAGGQLFAERELDVTYPLYDLMVGLLAVEAVDLASACLDQAIPAARASAAVPPLANLTCLRGWVSFRRGALALAEADARAAVELLTTHDVRLGFPAATGLLVQVLVEAGDPRAAERALAGSGVDTEVPSGAADTCLLEARGVLRIALGRTGEGLDDLVEFGRRRPRWGGADPLASRWRSHAALALAELGDHDQARRVAAEDLHRARRWGAPSELGTALRVAALVDDPAESLGRLREAVSVLEGSAARLEHARALVDLGAALRRDNHRSAARGPLREGLRLAEQCGAAPVLERARTELRAAGGRSSDPSGTGIEQLTTSERRVAELAAEGKSNPEIAQALFVTRKTVETHLGRVYVKLNIPGRAALGRAMPVPTHDQR